MYALIRLNYGSTMEAVVLANLHSRMRLAAPGVDDVVELQLRGLDWVDEHNHPVQFEFLTADDGGSAAPWLPHRAFGFLGYTHDTAYR